MQVAEDTAERFWRKNLPQSGPLPIKDLKKITSGYVNTSWLPGEPDSTEWRFAILAMQMVDFFAASACYYLLRASDSKPLRREVVDTITESRLLGFFRVPMEHAIHRRSYLPHRADELADSACEQIIDESPQQATLERCGNRLLRQWVEKEVGGSFQAAVSQARLHAHREAIDVLRSPQYAHLNTVSLSSLPSSPEDRSEKNYHPISESEFSYASNLAEEMYPIALTAAAKFPLDQGADLAVWYWLAGGRYDMRQNYWPRTQYAHAPELKEALKESMSGNFIRDHFQKKLGSLMTEAGMLQVLQDFLARFAPEKSACYKGEQEFLDLARQRNISIGADPGALAWRVFQQVCRRNAELAEQAEQERICGSESRGIPARWRNVPKEQLGEVLTQLRLSSLSDTPPSPTDLSEFACWLVRCHPRQQDWREGMRRLAAR